MKRWYDGIERCHAAVFYVQVTFMLYVFLFVGLAGAAAIGGANGWFATWNALWQLPLTFAGIFLSLVLLFALVMFVSTRLVDPKKLLEKPSRYFRFMLNQFCRLAFFLGGVHVHVTGMEKLPKKGRFMLVSNHLFAFDPLIYYYAIPRKNELAFLAKKETFSLFIVSEIMHELLCLPIDRENDRAALRTILKAIEYLKSDKTSIAVFPEGYTSKTGELQEFRNGTFKIAQKAGVPIVVCVLANTPAILKNMFRRHTDVYLDILDIIPPDELVGVTTVQIGSRVHETMKKGIDARRAMA